MPQPIQSFALSPSALTRFLGCEHRTYLDILERRGELDAERKPPSMELLFERGDRHEDAIVQRFIDEGHDVVQVDDSEAYDVRDMRRSAIQQALADTRVDGRMGTAALVTPPDLANEIWAEDLDLLSFAGRDENLTDAAWRLEVFLDYVCHNAAPVESYILGDRWHHLSLEGPDLDLRRALDTIQAIRGLPEPLQREVGAILKRFGAPTNLQSDPPTGHRPSA